jgi:hypothetical protein
MEIKTLSNSALQTRTNYLHFRIGFATCSIPYLNNKTAQNKTAFRAYKGKGSPEEIKDEVQILMIKNHLDENAFSDEALKKFLVDNNLGIECSGFSYHVLDAESVSRGHGHLKKHLKFIRCRGLIGKAVCSLRPVENCDVATFADDTNSRVISLNEIAAGDIITMTVGDVRHAPSDERNHILIIDKVEAISDIATQISYTHSVAYPEDGKYGTGVRQGTIEILNGKTDGITDARWTENSLEGSANRLFLRAQKCKTEVRRLKWF